MKYSGSCHCQRVKFECEFKLSKPALCNCSYCSMRNSIVHVADTININNGADELTCYRFNKMQGEHYFCKHCGIFVYLKPPAPIFPFAVNLCLLDNCNWREFKLFHFDGKQL